MSAQYDYIWKIIVGGEGGVGKTTILYRFIHNEFIEDTKMTIGCQFHTQLLERQGKRISLVMWDLGGQDRFRFIQGEYIKGASGCFLLFDMSRYPTLEACREWCDLYRQNAPGAPIVLVGTKLDLIDQATFDSVNQSATALAQELGCSCFIPTSSKLGVNVNESVQYIVDLLLYQSYNLEHGTTAATQ